MFAREAEAKGLFTLLSKVPTLINDFALQANLLSKKVPFCFLLDANLANQRHANLSNID
jgi:hypothetical protein